jgi:hypothetical protein
MAQLQPTSRTESYTAAFVQHTSASSDAAADESSTTAATASIPWPACPVVGVVHNRKASYDSKT